MNRHDNNAASGCVYALVACLPLWAMVIWGLWRWMR